MIIILFIFFFFLYISSCNIHEGLESKDPDNQYDKETREKIIENAGKIKYISDNISKLFSQASELTQKVESNKRFVKQNRASNMKI